MKRKLFFLLERLQISRNERIAVSALSVMVIILGSATLFWHPKPAYSEEEYEKLEKIFEMKSREITQEREMILARYQPMAKQSQSAGFAETEQAELVQNDTIRPPAGQPEPETGSQLININSATEEELRGLPGIGPAYSRRIVEWRNENGRFTSVEQLLEIKGIGEKRLMNIKPLITL